MHALAVAPVRSPKDVKPFILPVHEGLLSNLQNLRCRLLLCRFFAESCATLVCQVFGRRNRKALPPPAAMATVPSLNRAAAAKPEPSVFDYYITDGLYGSFNCIMYDHAQPTARPLRCPGLPPLPSCGGGGAKAGEAVACMFPSTVFGPSCDGLDTVFQVWRLPAIAVFPVMCSSSPKNLSALSCASADRCYELAIIIAASLSLHLFQWYINC